MKFSVGNRVKFIDQVGEGIVKKVISESVLIIEDEDGFEYEVQASSVIPVADKLAEESIYNTALPSETEVFTKNVDEDKLAAAQKKFADQYDQNEGLSSKDFIEVDLHIHELLDYTANMSNSEMLTHQVRHFERMMKMAERKKIKKVVFIHGVGEGVLRAELRRLIDQFYPNCSYSDGNYRTYGIGATQVNIRYN